MTPVSGMLIGIAIGCAGALGGVYLAWWVVMGLVDRIDAEALKEEAGQ